MKHLQDFIFYFTFAIGICSHIVEGAKVDRGVFLSQLATSLLEEYPSQSSFDATHVHSVSCRILEAFCPMEPAVQLQLIRELFEPRPLAQQTKPRADFQDQTISRSLLLNHLASPRPLDPIESGPQQIHLSLTGDPTEMYVVWVDKEIETQPQVAWQDYHPNFEQSHQPSSTQVIFTASANRTTYDAGVFGWQGWIYTAKMRNLINPAGTIYRVGSSAKWSEWFHFQKTPQTPAERDHYTFALYGDQGTYIPWGWKVIDRVVQDTPKYGIEALIHLGDLCYAGTGDQDEFEEIWDMWSNLIQPIASQMPYQTTVGNHEKYYNYSSFTHRFIMDGSFSGGLHDFWFSFQYGNVFFVSMSTEHPYEVNTPQYVWLKGQFEKSRQMRKQYPWLIVLGHRPMYCSDEDEWTSHSPGGHFQKTLEKLFHDYNVNAYFCGHSHMYERVNPVFNATVAQNGNNYVRPGATLHVDQATAGVFLDRTFHQPQPAWSAFRTNKWGYGLMTIKGNSMTYQFIHQDDGSVIDQFTLTI